MLVTPPESIARGFYTRAFEWRGIYVLANQGLPKDAIMRAADIIFNSMANADGFSEEMESHGALFAIIPEGTPLTALPDYAELPELFPEIDWDQYRGLGATLSIPTASAGEENILKYPGDPFGGEENVALHEWAHSIDALALQLLDPDLHQQWLDAYDDAMTQGLWADTNAATDATEYFAELTQAYFDDNPERDAPDGVHNSINTRAELAAYDPVAFGLLTQIYGDSSWRPGSYYGTAGKDHFEGTPGDDLINGNEGADLLNGRGGGDYLLSGTGQDILSGGQGDDQLRGGAGQDHLSGGGGADILAGAKGIDFVTGGAGSDAFLFDLALYNIGGDTITDFNPDEDTVWLSAELFRKLPVGPLAADAFAANDAGNAETSVHRIMYAFDSGGLYYDRDGTGPVEAKLIASLGPGLDLSAAHFLVV